MKLGNSTEKCESEISFIVETAGREIKSAEINKAFKANGAGGQMDNLIALFCSVDGIANASTTYKSSLAGSDAKQ